MTSPKHRFLQRNDEDIDSIDNIIEVSSDYDPNPTGLKVHQSLARTRILRGGLGSGKTRCAAEHVNAILTQYPGAFGIVARRDITMLKVTTQKEYLEKVVRPETVDSFNVNENKLYYNNGSMLLFADAKVPQDFKSTEIAVYDVDEADENPSPELWEILDDRLRQKIKIDGKWVAPPYAGLLVFNPTSEDHWLYDLAQRTDIDVEDFRFDTYENEKNLPVGYIENLKRKLPLWEIDRLVHGHWGRKISGKPVIHGFHVDTHVRSIKVLDHLPIIRGWDFGYNHPAVGWYQANPVSGRIRKLREFVGKNMKLHQVAPEVKKITNGLVSPGYPVFDYGDPHGADEKDTGESSVEYLRIHHGIFVQHKRTRIKSGLDEIQEKILSLGKVDEEEETEKQEPLIMVDHSCKITIAALQGGYHRDAMGVPLKDGFYDHSMDELRYVVVSTMNSSLAQRFQKRRYVPRNFLTGY